MFEGCLLLTSVSLQLKHILSILRLSSGSWVSVLPMRSALWVEIEAWCIDWGMCIYMSMGICHVLHT